MPNQPEVVPAASRTQRRRSTHGRITEAGAELAARQIFDLLSTHDPSDLREQLQTDSQFYTRLIQVLARLREVALKAERELTERKAKLERRLAKARKGKGGLPPDTVRDLEQQLRLL